MPEQVSHHFFRNNQLNILTSLRQQGDQLPLVGWGLKGSKDMGFPVLKLRKFWANWDKLISLSGSDTESGMTMRVLILKTLGTKISSKSMVGGWDANFW